MAGSVFANDKYVTSTDLGGGKVGLDVALTGDVQIGAVEIKDATTANRAIVTAGGALTVTGTFTPSGTQDENLKQVNGATVNVGSGVAGAGTQRVILASDQTVVPVSDNGGSLTVDTPQLPTTIGTKVAAASLSVTTASDEVVPLGQATKAASIPVVEGSSATATTANVASNAASVQFLALNTARTGFLVYNDGSDNIFLKYGTTASATSFTVKIPAGGTWEDPFKYTGRIDGIWDVATGSARITEIS